jgi:hypothetical protein
MVPLIWLAARNSEKRVCDRAVPPLVKADDVPLYALDKHTRLGREAIWRLACENDCVRACLARFVPARQTRAAPVARRLMWEQSKALEAFGIERDLLHAGVAAEGIQPLLEAMRANLEHLNELRAQILTRAQKATVTIQIGWCTMTEAITSDNFHLSRPITSDLGVQMMALHFRS